MNSKNNVNGNKIKIRYGTGESIIIENGFMRVARSHHKLKLPQQLDNDLAYLAGYHLGDGYLENVNNTLKIQGKGGYEIDYADSDPKQLQLINTIIKDKFNHKLRIYKRPKVNLWIGRISSCRALHWFLHRKLRLPMGRREIIRIPNWISEKKELTSSFLSGFFDAEADVSKTINRIVNCKKYYKLRIQLTQRDITILSEIKEILHKYFGINSDIQPKWKQEAYILRIGSCKMVKQFMNHINFRNPSKRKKLSDLVASL